MAGDANYGDVVLLLHGDSTFADTSTTPKTVTAVNAVISSAQSQFGGASMYFDGTGDYLTLPSFSLGSGDFTIEAWVYITALATYHSVIETRATPGSYQNYVFGIINSTGTLRLDYVNVGGAGTRLRGTSTAVSLNTWTHVALVRSAGVLMCFVDGVKDATTMAYSGTLTPASGTALIGTTIDPSYFNGYLDDLRITVGVARYTATFTPPTSAFLDYAAQVSGIVRDSTNALCARTVRAYNRSTGALVASTASNGTTGAYTLNCAAAGEVSVIALDDVAGTTENDLILRTTPA